METPVSASIAGKRAFVDTQLEEANEESDDGPPPSPIVTLEKMIRSTTGVPRNQALIELVQFLRAAELRYVQEDILKTGLLPVLFDLIGSDDDFQAIVASQAIVLMIITGVFTHYLAEDLENNMYLTELLKGVPSVLKMTNSHSRDVRGCGVYLLGLILVAMKKSPDVACSILNHGGLSILTERISLNGDDEPTYTNYGLFVIGRLITPKTIQHPSLDNQLLVIPLVFEKMEDIFFDEEEYKGNLYTEYVEINPTFRAIAVSAVLVMLSTMIIHHNSARTLIMHQLFECGALGYISHYMTERAMIVRVAAIDLLTAVINHCDTKQLTAVSTSGAFRILSGQMEINGHLEALDWWFLSIERLLREQGAKCMGTHTSNPFTDAFLKDGLLDHVIRKSTRSAFWREWESRRWGVILDSWQEEVHRAVIQDSDDDMNST